MTIEAQTSSRRRRNTSKAAEKASEVGDEDESERSDVSRKSIKGNKPGRSLSLRPRKSKYLQNPITCIIGGISVVFTAYFTWTTMKTLSKKERPTPTVFFHPPDVKTTRILENKRTEDPNPMDGHAIRTTTLRGSRDDDQAIEKVMKVHSPRPIHKPIHHYSKTSWTAREPDYGGLRISLPIASGIPRKIREYYYEPNTSPDHGDDDDTGHESPSYDEYYAFDDDILRATDGVAAKPFQDPSCRRVQEHRYSFPNCNDFHQLDPADAANNEFQFINKGGFREVFSIRTPQDIFAIKEILFEKINVSRYFELMEYVRMDAIVAERLSASPRIYDIYGYCALSIASEFFFHGDIEALSGGEIAYHPPVKNDDAETSRDDDDAWRPKNVFTPAQKLVLGLDMAEGLADLHGYDGGVIIHDDVQLSQYLLNKDKTRLKLNDFNRAEFALWNGTDYCRHQNGHGKGDWRSPEEYKDRPLTEEIDVWSYGNNLYTILLGRYPFFNMEDNAARRLVPEGATPYVDKRYLTRSPEEKAVAEVVMGCFEYEPSDRPTIFEIVEHLRKAVKEHVEGKGITRSAVLQQIKLS